MSYSEVAKRYAKAFFLNISENKKMDQINSEFKEIAYAMDADKEIKLFIQNPLISNQDKSNVIENMIIKLGFSDETKEFFKLLSLKNRIENAKPIADEISNLVNVKNGITKGYAESAFELSSEQKNEIQEKLSKQLSKKIELNFAVNKELLGGIVVSVDGLKIDDSVKMHIKKLNEELNKGVQ